MAEVCVDASFALKLVLDEPERPRVRRQWAEWVRDGVSPIAPWLWTFETHSVLRRNVVRGSLSEEQARAAWHLLQRQGVQTVHPHRLMDRAWALASELSRPITYDMVYVALADLRGCELWTADQRLINATGARFAWIRSA
jgi:predicted nucleic acid-binding protein